MRFKKEEFIEALINLRNMTAREEEILDAFKISPEWSCGEWIYNYYKMIEQMCDLDPEENLDYGNDLAYWVYELDFGNKWRPGYVTEDGTDIKLETEEDLWNFLTREE